jgi:hypothetical protein
VYAKHCRAGKLTPHFAHAPGAACVSATETSIHLAAKQLIYDRKLFFFPALIASVEVIDAMAAIHRASRTVWVSACRELLHVELEQAVASIRPDVLVDLAGFGKIAIEIAVTHFADEGKKATLRGLGLAAVEVDLSDVRDATFEVLEALLFDGGSAASWLHHPAVEAAEASLLEEIEPALAEARVMAMKAKRALEARRLLEYEQRSQSEREGSDRQRHELLDRQAAESDQRRREEAQQRKTEQFFAADEAEKLAILLRWLGRDTLPLSVYAPMPWKTTFGATSAHVWQTALFSGLIHRRPARGLFVLTFDTALRWLRERFESSFVDAETDEMALRVYLKALIDRGALVSRRQGYFLMGVADLACFDSLQHFRANPEMPIYALADRANWVSSDEWPKAKQPTVIALVMSGSISLTESWYRLSILQDNARAGTPHRMCEYADTLGIDPRTALEYLVRAGFVRLPG